MRLMYHKIAPYKCQVCGQEMIYFQNKKGMVLDYRGILNQGKTLSETKEMLENHDIKFFKCIYCNRRFIIDWTEGWPKPLYDREKLRNFGV